MHAEAAAPGVLVVEDEAPIRELLPLHLELAGFAIEEVGDGRAALDRARVERPSVSHCHTSTMALATGAQLLLTPRRCQWLSWWWSWTSARPANSIRGACVAEVWRRR